MKCLDSLKNGKSAGDDKITNEMIKVGKTVLMPLLIRLFNLVFANTKCPTIWNKSVIVPLHKADCPSDPNYRGISITSCIGKLYKFSITQQTQKTL